MQLEAAPPEVSWLVADTGFSRTVEASSAVTSEQGSTGGGWPKSGLVGEGDPLAPGVADSAGALSPAPRLGLRLGDGVDVQAVATTDAASSSDTLNEDRGRRPGRSVDMLRRGVYRAATLQEDAGGGASRDGGADDDEVDAGRGRDRQVALEPGDVKRGVAALGAFRAAAGRPR